MAQGTKDDTSRSIYPNPFILDFNAPKLTFANLPLGATLRIFTLDGQRVRQIDGEPGRGTLVWNGQNEAGNLVGSGMYFFVAENEIGAMVKGKVVVINQR